MSSHASRENHSRPGQWLGNERKEFKAGTLLIIPRGTPHQGQIVSSGPVKAITIKIPPQAPDDTGFVD
jgi:mannose-6-phosphate isomerase-like protein (cupin superfamily)